MYGGPSQINYLEEISQYSKNGLFAVAGNDDNIIGRYSIKGDKVYNAHETSFILDNEYAIIGLEGSTGTIGNLLYSEEDADAHLNTMLNEIGNRKIILISHTPPYKVLDYAIRFGKEEIGSKALRRFIESNSERIELVICGHAHLQGGNVNYLNGVPVVNCASHDGPYEPGKIALINLQTNNVSINWEFIHDHLQNLMRIPMIAEKRAKVLLDYGITSIEEFCNLPKDHELSMHPSFKYFFDLIQTHAIALLQKRVIIKNKDDTFFEDLRDFNLYFLDAEYDPERTSSGPYGIYLWGCNLTNLYTSIKEFKKKGFVLRNNVLFRFRTIL